MRIAVDLARCEGFANCVMAAPDVFDLGNDGLVVVLEPVCDDDRRAEVEEAVRSCPVSALRLVDVP